MVRLRSENKELQRTVQELRKTTSENQEAINSLEQYGRRECLEIKGLAWTQHENTDELIVATAKKLHVNIKKDDISVSHRLSKCNKDNPSTHHHCPFLFQESERLDLQQSEQTA